MAMREVDHVIHAAALKHVPTAEYNPFECIHTNVYGAENVVQAALRAGVKRVIALSTDKAANPVNLYGASKLAADKIFVAANNLSGTLGTRFSVVRYGNVLGSRGSVVPFFKRQIAEGATSLPITDARMTRFWITLSQGVDFVLSSLAMSLGGEIFVPKIPSLKITDLALGIAPEASHTFTGVRPGEKIHEVMITSDDARNTVALEDRYIIRPRPIDGAGKPSIWEECEQVAEDFEYASDTNDEWLAPASVRALLNTLED
jgi:UDP-N-acetylglucosamine 4,6-dehydratase